MYRGGREEGACRRGNGPGRGQRSNVGSKPCSRARGDQSGQQAVAS